MKLGPDEVGRKWVVSVGASEAGSGIMMHSRDRDLLQDFAGSSTPTDDGAVSALLATANGGPKDVEFHHIVDGHQH